MPYNEQEKNNPSEMTGKHNGMQGIDKAPGEENAENTDNVVWESQKGKKEDGDPSQASDQPLDIKRGADN